jgi:predicted unusual protein kinase regulating ubiquinone biosynthesis (AarF/ABC1/UbiB family)
MQYLDGEPIESLAGRQRALRNQIGTTLLELGLREVFDWGLVQTDPNFANFRFNSHNGAIQLLDFGGTRAYSDATRASLGNLIRAGMDGSDKDLLREAAAVGYIDENDPKAYRSGVLMLVRAATEPARSVSDYNFGQSDLARRISDTALELRLNTCYGRLPPPDVLFLHRKLGGLYLLFSRLNASIPVRQLLTQILEGKSAGAKVLSDGLDQYAAS